MKIINNWPLKNQILPILCLCKQVSYRQGHFPRHKFYVYPMYSKLQIEITKTETPKIGAIALVLMDTSIDGVKKDSILHNRVTYCWAQKQPLKVLRRYMQCFLSWTTNILPISPRQWRSVGETALLLIQKSHLWNPIKTYGYGCLKGSTKTHIGGEQSWPIQNISTKHSKQICKTQSHIFKGLPNQVYRVTLSHTKRLKSEKIYIFQRRNTERETNSQMQYSFFYFFKILNFCRSSFNCFFF